MKKHLVAAVLFLSGVASAAPTAEISFEQTPDQYPYMTDSQFESAKKYVKESSKRKVARVDSIDENVALSPEARHLRNIIIGGPATASSKFTMKPTAKGIQSSDQLAALIEELDNDELYNKKGADGKIIITEKTLPQDAQLVAALLVAMKPFRGFTVRAKPLIEDYKFLHSMVVTMLRTTATGINVFLPTEQWKAGFKFVTEPYVGLDKSKMITNDEQFRAFMANEVILANNKLTVRLAQMDFSNSPVYIDNKVAFATANFVADEDRFMQLGESERYTALGSVLLARSALYSSVSYSWRGLFESIQETMTKVYGFEQVFNVEGATARRRTQVIKEQNGKLFVKTAAAKWAMPRAYASLKEGFRNIELSYDQLQKDQNNNAAFRNLFDPRAVVPITRILDTSLGNVRSIARGDAVVSALVAGESVRFDIQKFFGENTSPNNLLDFLPTGFDNGCKTFSNRGKCATEVSTKTGIEYRNYMEGSPTAWNMSVYNSYFPDVNSKSNSADKVRNAARILSQSWGGWIIGVPLAGMVL